jgi:DNA-binding transcriptional regulator LsrR (DeoR family)
MATKKEMQDKRDRARMYYMQGESQKDVAACVGVSEVTVSDWAKKDGWGKLRAGSKVTRTELVNKNLELIAKLLDGVMASDDPTSESVRVSDQISKLAASIERLDKKANVVNEIDSFMNFNKWLQVRIGFDKSLSPELLKEINKYQDIYVGERMGKN